MFRPEVLYGNKIQCFISLASYKNKVSSLQRGSEHLRIVYLMTILHVNIVVTKNVKDRFNEVKMERAFIIMVLAFTFSNSYHQNQLLP